MKTLRILIWIFFFLLRCPDFAAASSSGFEKIHCLPSSLVDRTGNENCWARLRLDELRVACLSHFLWLHWLKERKDSSLCYDPRSRWRTWSPLNNTETDPKQLRMTLKINPIVKLQKQSQEQPQGNRSVLSRSWSGMWKQIEIIRERISELLAPGDSLGILRSLVLNQGSQHEPLPMLRRLGFVHLISASGIHLYTLVLGCDRLTRFGANRLGISVRLGLRWSRALSFCVCSFLWILGGCKLGMLRPGFHLILRELSSYLGFRWQKAAPLFLTILAEGLLTHPMNLQNRTSGRWFYTLAVGGGLFWHSSFRSSHLGLAIGSWLLLGLIEAGTSGTVSIATPLLSLLTIPLVCWVIYPLLILFTFLFLIVLFFSRLILENAPPPTLLAECIDFLSLSLTKGILLIARLTLLPGNLWMIPRWAIVSGMLASGFLIVQLAPIDPSKPKRSRYRRILPLGILAGAILIRFLVLSIGPSIGLSLEPRARGIGESRKPVATQIEQIDVGHGDATLVISAPTQNQATLAAGLIDTGRGSGLGDIQWLDLLASRGLRKIAWIALTHLDEDHTGGLKKLAALVPIDCVALPLPYLRTKKASQLLKLVLKQGTQIRDWNSGCIPYPTRVLGDAQKLGVPNGIMGAVWIPLAQGGFYLSAGDARREEEFTLGKWAASLADQSWVQPQDPRILKISHHGSKTSTTPEFLKWVRPSEAWISVGAGNAYGHPAPLVLNNLLRLGIRIRRTDRDGLLSLKSRR